MSKEKELIEKIIPAFLLGVLDAQVQALIECCEIDENKVAFTDKLPKTFIGIHLGGIMSTLTMLDTVEYSDNDTIHAKGLCNNLASQIDFHEPFEMA